MPKRLADTKMGRPERSISKDEFESLCQIQCTEDEICAVLHVSKATLLRWCKRIYDGQTFAEVYKKYADAGKVSLRRTQWKQAKTNYQMAIWLGKQYLGQSDNVNVKADEAQLAKLDDILTAVERNASRGDENDENDGGTDD